MIEIGKTVVSTELFEQLFVCDLGACKGQCCFDGDSGAPLEDGEIEELKAALPAILDIIPQKSRELIEKQGVSYVDEEGDNVTSIVNGNECVFAFVDTDGSYKCALEKAYYEGKTTFVKPISCHLYPIRLREYRDFTAVNYHMWQVCESARQCGKKLNVPVYKFLKNPLVRKFGEEWYKDLEQVAEAYLKDFKKP